MKTLRLKKGFLLLLLTLALVLVMSAAAMAVTVTDGESFVEALGGEEYAKAEGNTVTLLADVIDGTEFGIGSSEYVLDLNGHRIYNAAFAEMKSSYIYLRDAGGKLTIKDSKGGGSFDNAIYIDGGELVLESGGLETFRIDSGAVNISGGTLNGSISIYGGTVNVKGGEFLAPEADPDNNIYNNSANINGGTMNVSGGKFTGRIFVNEGGTLNFKGGEIVTGFDAALRVEGGTANVSGGKISAWWGCTVGSGVLNMSGGQLIALDMGGLAVYGGKAVLSGGSIIGKTSAAIYVDGGVVGDLLAEGYELSGSAIPDGFDAATYGDTGTGTATVVKIGEKPAAATSFNDVAKDAWYYTYVTDLASSGVVNGYPDGTFKPQGKVTWGEGLKLIMAAAGYEAQAASGSHWASGYADKALADGLIAAAVADLNAAIDREAIAEIAAKALKLPASTIESPFADAELASLNALYEAKIIEGSLDANGQRLYKPNDNITRAEISAIIWRINNYGK